MGFDRSRQIVIPGGDGGHYSAGEGLLSSFGNRPPGVDAASDGQAPVGPLRSPPVNSPSEVLRNCQPACWSPAFANGWGPRLGVSSWVRGGEARSRERLRQCLLNPCPPPLRTKQQRRRCRLDSLSVSPGRRRARARSISGRFSESPGAPSRATWRWPVRRWEFAHGSRRSSGLGILASLAWPSRKPTRPNA